MPFPIAQLLYTSYDLVMLITRKDAESLFTPDGFVDLPRLSHFLQTLPHLWNLSREVSFLVSERLMAEKEDGGWRGDRAVRAIEFSGWLNARTQGVAAVG